MKSFVDSTKKMVFQWRDWLLKYISFGSHQGKTIEGTKALYDMYKWMLIIWEKRAWKYFEFLSIPIEVFYSQEFL